LPSPSRNGIKPDLILMAVSRTLLRATAMTAESAGDCLDYVNRVLVRQSDSAMFVTIFYGILHTDRPQSAVLHLAEAGRRDDAGLGRHDRTGELHYRPRATRAG
jgi:sigma-B regulation protein RsbU (phosphoserine phosphatase)